MTYTNDMNTISIPQVVAETTPYIKAVNVIWDEETQIEFKNYIGANPYKGDIIPHTGGIRKIRWQSGGHGKRGGARIIYYLYNENHPIYLLFAYPKNVQVNLSETETKLLKSAVAKLKEVFRTKEESSHEK